LLPPCRRAVMLCGWAGSMFRGTCFRFGGRTAILAPSALVCRACELPDIFRCSPPATLESHRCPTCARALSRWWGRPRASQQCRTYISTCPGFVEG
jgi:hypothetical protein